MNNSTVGVCWDESVFTSSFNSLSIDLEPGSCASYAVFQHTEKGTCLQPALWQVGAHRYPVYSVYQAAEQHIAVQHEFELSSGI